MSGTSGGAFLFQRVWVGHGAQGLLRVLKGSVQSEGYGRRLELPSKLVNHDTALANPIRLLDIHPHMLPSSPDPYQTNFHQERGWWILGSISFSLSGFRA